MQENFILLKAPIECKQIYNKLLLEMAKVGEDLLTECNASCTGSNKEIIACWNMFNAACAAYELQEYSKYKTLINYICSTLNITLQEDYKYIYITQSNNYDKYAIEDKQYKLVKHTVVDDLDINIKIHQVKKYHILLIPKDTFTIEESKYGNSILTTYIVEKGINHLYSRDNVTIDDEYAVYYYYSPVGEIDDTIEVKLKID